MRLNLLPYVSKFLINVNDTEIESERQQLEAEYRVKLKVDSKTIKDGPVVLILYMLKDLEREQDVILLVRRVDFIAEVTVELLDCSPLRSEPM